MPSQVIQIPIGAGGIDTKTAKEYVDPNSKALAVTNGVFTYDGSAEKRRGCAALTTYALGATIGTPLRVASRRDEILLIDGDGLATYSPNGVAWSGKSRVSPCVITREPISVTNTAVTLPDYYTSYSLAKGNGFRIVVFRDASQNILWNLYDLTTGAALVVNVVIGGGIGGYAPTVIILGTVAYLFYSTNSSSGGATGTIWGTTLTLTTAGIVTGWAAPTAIVTDGGTQGTATSHFVPYQATPEVDGTGIVIFYPQHSVNGGSGASQHQMRYLRLEALPALTIVAAATVSAVYTSSYCTTCCVREDEGLGFAWFGWEIDAGGTYTQYAVKYNAPAWSPVAAVFATVFTAASGSVSVGALECDFDTSVGADITAGVFVAFFTNGGAAGGSEVVCYTGAGASVYNYLYPFGYVTSRPFRMAVGAGTHTFVAMQVTQNTGYGLPIGSAAGLVSGILVDVSHNGPAGSFAPRQCSTSLGNDARLVNVTNIGIGTGSVNALVPTIGSAEFDAANVANTSPTVANVNCVTFDFTGALGWQPAEGDGETFFSGGIASVYDTKCVQEIGWLVWPGGITYVNSTSGGTIPDGTFEYAFCFAYADDAGLVHRSYPWTATIVTSGGGTSSIAFTMPVTPLTMHYGSERQPVIEVYRTDTNLSTLYFVQGVNFTPGSGTVTFTDDNSLFATSNPLIYTTGGVLVSLSPPALRCMVRHVERLWGIDDTGLNIWYSQPFNGVDAPYFNEALTLTFTDQTLTALGEMDDKLIVFSARSVWYVEGQGPAINGQGSDLNVAVQIPSDMGATDWRSVVSFPGGVFFQAPTGGIYLLDRGIGITFKGKDVQDITSPPNRAPVAVLSATLVADGTTVRFCLANGTILVYNYFFDRWSTTVFAAPAEDVNAPFGTVSASCIAGGVWTAASITQGCVIQEKLPQSSTVNYDTNSSGGSTWVPMTIALPWVKPGGLQGWAQVDMVQGIARMLNACDLTITLAYDYKAGPNDVKSYTFAELNAQNTTMAQWRAGPSAANMQPEAISVTLADAPPTSGFSTTGAGVRWLGVAFAVTSLGTIYEKLGTGVKQ